MMWFKYDMIQIKKVIWKYVRPQIGNIRGKWKLKTSWEIEMDTELQNMQCIQFLSFPICINICLHKQYVNEVTPPAFLLLSIFIFPLFLTLFTTVFPHYRLLCSSQCLLCHLFANSFSTFFTPSVCLLNNTIHILLCCASDFSFFS